MGCLIFEFQISTSIHMVPVAGLEPARYPLPVDFESTTSANSITPAKEHIRLYVTSPENASPNFPLLRFRRKLPAHPG